MIFLLLAPVLATGSNVTLLDYVTDRDGVIDVYANIFACPAASCENGGRLLSNGTAPSCVCSEFFEGVCCATKRCIMDGSLIDTGCACPPGHYGDHCEKFSCNDGLLVYHGGRHFCQCPKHSQGKYCELPRCLNDGELVSQNFYVDEAVSASHQLEDQVAPTHHICDCKPGYYGPNCEYMQCVHGRRRKSHSNVFCQCDFSYTGIFCEEIHLGVACLVVVCVAMVAAVLLSVILYCARRTLWRKRASKRTRSTRDGAAQPLIRAPPPKPERRSNDVSRL